MVLWLTEAMSEYRVVATAKMGKKELGLPIYRRMGESDTFSGTMSELQKMVNDLTRQFKACKDSEVKDDAVKFTRATYFKKALRMMLPSSSRDRVWRAFMCRVSSERRRVACGGVPRGFTPYALRQYAYICPLGGARHLALWCE